MRLTPGSWEKKYGYLIQCAQSSEGDGRSPGDFHSTGASYVPRKDCRGTKPAQASLSCASNATYQGPPASRKKYDRYAMSWGACQMFRQARNCLSARMISLRPLYLRARTCIHAAAVHRTKHLEVADEVQ